MVTLCREAESLSLPLLSGRQPGGAGSGNFWELKGEEEVLRTEIQEMFNYNIYIFPSCRLTGKM